MTDTVLITRPAPGAEGTAEAVRARGWQPVLAPLLRITPFAEAHPEPLPDPAAIQAVLVASGHALGLPPAFHACPLLAVGNATAARARGIGFADVRSANGDAMALAALAANTLDPRGGPVLLATGRGQGMPLAGLLHAAGFTVLRRVIYAAVPEPHLPAAASEAIVVGLHAATFLSAETARVFAHLLPDSMRPLLARTDALAISKTVADVLTPLPWRRIRVALRPTQSSLIALL